VVDNQQIKRAGLIFDRARLAFFIPVKIPSSIFWRSDSINNFFQSPKNKQDGLTEAAGGGGWLRPSMISLSE